MKIQTLDELMADYDKERIAEIDRWEKNKPQWIKDKVEEEKKRDIERGIRDEDGFFVIPDDDAGDSDDEEDDNG